MFQNLAKQNVDEKKNKGHFTLNYIIIACFFYFKLIFLIIIQCGLLCRL